MEKCEFCDRPVEFCACADLSIECESQRFERAWLGLVESIELAREDAADLSILETPGYLTF